MNLQDSFPALKIRQLYRYPPVKPAGPQQGGVQCFGAVGGRQDHNTLAAVKTIHFSEQLVEGLLTLIIAADALGVSLLTNGIDLVYKDDAGSFFIGLLEKITDLGSAHAYKHFYEFRAGDGKEGDICLACHCLGKKCFAGTRRADQQHALRHFCANFLIFSGIVEEIHNFHQIFFSFVLACHIAEFDAGFAGDIDLGVALAKLHGVAHGPAAHLIHQHPAHQLPNDNENGDRQDEGQQKAEDGIHLWSFYLVELAAGIQQPVDQIRVVKSGSTVQGVVFRVVSKVDSVFFYLDCRYLVFFQHGKEGTV